jgi:hypothetical protein
MLNFFFVFLLGGKKVHPYYRAILNRATALGHTLPSIAIQIKQNQLVDDMVNAGLWSKMDGFWNFYHDGGKTFGYINWINPTSTVAVESGGVTFVALDGISGAAVDYVDTAWSESTHGVNWLLGDSAFFIDIKESGQEAAYICGAQDGTSQYTRIRTRTATDILGVRIDHPNNENTVASLDGSGFWFIGRLVSAVQVWRNGTLFTSFVNTQGPARVVNTHNVLRTNTPGATVSSKTVRCYGVMGRGAGLEQVLYDLFNKYKTP